MPDGAGRPRFFVDAMLGSVARKLRMFGYDSRYDPGIGDAELVRIARDERRVIVTRDRDLAGRCQGLGHESVLVAGTCDGEQLREVLGRLREGRPEMSGDAARCTRRNSVTRPASGRDVDGTVPPGVLELHERFWRCARCGQVYWEGTHVRNLREFAEGEL